MWLLSIAIIVHIPSGVEQQFALTLKALKSDLVDQFIESLAFDVDKESNSPKEDYI